MKRSNDDIRYGDDAGDASNGRSLASSLAPLSAKIEETNFGYSLEIAPMRAFDALRLWPRLSDHEEASALVYDVIAGNERRMAAAGVTPDLTLAQVAERLEIPVIEEFSNQAIVMEPACVRELAGMLDAVALRSVLVEGPIDRRDAVAMAAAVAQGDSPLLAELRAVAAINVRRDRVIELHTRVQEQALRLVGESFRHYVASLQRRPVEEFAAPEPWQLERLLGISGSLAVRPIETDMFSTSVDVGISTSLQQRPADRSLIYDLPSNTWHDEP